MKRDLIASLTALAAGTAVTVLASHGVIRSDDAETLAGAIAAGLALYHVPNGEAAAALRAARPPAPGRLIERTVVDCASPPLDTERSTVTPPEGS